MAKVKHEDDDGDRIVGTAPAAPDGPEYDENGRLTRRGMEAVLAAGGSVAIHRTNADGAAIGTAHITRPDQLPTEAQLAKGDAQREQAARENLLRQKRAIEEQIAGLGKAEK